MLKSLSTQFAATLLFGPLGLAYSSVAAAVFLTLLFAVLYFTDLGMLAAVIVTARATTPNRAALLTRHLWKI